MADHAPGTDPRLIAIACGNFVVGASGSLVIGLLNEVSQDLDVSIPVAGQLVAAMSLSTAVCAPLLAFATSAMGRRRLLALSLALVALCQGLSAVAPAFAVLVLARVLAGVPAATYTPAAAATAGLLVTPALRGQAVMTVGLGHSAASIVGVPAGVFLGGLFGWRVAMAVFGVLAVVVLVWLRSALPARLPQTVPPRGTLGAILRNRGLTSTLAVAFLQAFGQFMLFSYIAPSLKAMIGASTNTVSLMLGWFGVCALIGNLVGVRLIGRLGPTRFAFLALACIVVGHLVWPLGSLSVAAVVVSCGVWGMGMFSLNSAQQARLIAFAPDLGGITIAFNTALVFAGSAAAAAVGGLVIAYLGIAAVVWVGLGLLLLAVAALAFSSRYDPPRA